MKISLVIAGLLLAAGSTFAQAPPPAQTAPPLPQDKHDGLTLSVDAYTKVPRGKEKFGKANPLAVGILPVEVFLRNDTSLPVKLNINTIQLEVRSSTGAHQDLDWMDPLEVATAVAHPGGPSQPKVRRFPPIGVSVPKDDKRDKMLSILRPFSLDADIVPPRGTIQGFLFFDVAGEIPAPGDASLYVPDLTVATSKATLMFFEVALQPAPPAAAASEQ